MNRWLRGAFRGRMKKVYYGDLEVEFTDKEYETLQAIKQQRYDAPPRGEADRDKFVGAYFKLPAALRERAQSYAQAHEINFSDLMRLILEVLTE